MLSVDGKRKYTTYETFFGWSLSKPSTFKFVAAVFCGFQYYLDFILCFIHQQECFCFNFSKPQFLMSLNFLFLISIYQVSSYCIIPNGNRRRFWWIQDHFCFHWTAIKDGSQHNWPKAIQYEWWTYTGHILDSHCVRLSNAAPVCKNYAELYSDAKHLEKGLNRVEWNFGGPF